MGRQTQDQHMQGFRCGEVIRLTLNLRSGSIAGLLTQGARGAARPPWPRDCMGSNGSYLLLAPLTDRELSL